MAGSLLKDAVADTRLRMADLVQQNRTKVVVVTALFVALTGLGISTLGRDDNSTNTNLRADQVAVGPSGGQSDAGGGPPETLQLGQGGANQDPLAPAGSNYANSYAGINTKVVNPRRNTFTTSPGATGDETSATTAKPSGGTGSDGGAGGSASTGGGSNSGGSNTGASPSTGSSVAISVPPSAFDANRVAYVSGGATWTINPDGSDAQQVTNNAYFPAWSRAHNALAVADRDRSGGALSILSLTSRRTITPTPTRSTDGDSAPSWSPDGSKIVFARTVNSSTQFSGSIWTVNADGTGEKRISIAGCYSEDPTWSPDGSKIVFWSSRDHCGANGQSNDGRYELYVMNADGSAVRALGTATNSGAAAFSPDGLSIAFSSDRDSNDGFDIYTMRLDGSNLKKLTTASGDDTDPTWSPDGSRIAFRTARSSGAIYTMKSDGSDARFLVGGAQPAWS